MGAPTSANVISGKPLVTGGVLWAPPGTAVPTDPTTALAAAYQALGYAHKDGLKGSEKKDSTAIQDWGGLTVAVLTTGFTDTFKFGFLEFLNPLVATTIYGAANVTATPATATKGNQLKVAVNGAESPHGVWVFEMGTGIAKARITVPDGQVTELEDTDYKSDDLVGRKVTLTAFPDASGNTHYVYTDDGRKTA